MVAIFCGLFCGRLIAGEGGWFHFGDIGLRGKDSSANVSRRVLRVGSDCAERPQAQRPRSAARHLHGGRQGGGGSRCRDARSGSLQRMVRRFRFMVLAWTEWKVSGAVASLSAAD
jgi:hypothetical protein